MHQIDPDSAWREWQKFLPVQLTLNPDLEKLAIAHIYMHLPMKLIELLPQYGGATLHGMLVTTSFCAGAGDQSLITPTLVIDYGSADAAIAASEHSDLLKKFTHCCHGVTGISRVWVRGADIDLVTVRHPDKTVSFLRV
jgi:hypothetical protein